MNMSFETVQDMASFGKLVEKSIEPTRGVSKVLSGVQTVPRNTIANVDHAVDKVAKPALIGSSEQALREIVALVDQTTDEVLSITTALELRSLSCEKIKRTTDGVTSVGKKISHAMRQSKQAETYFHRQILMLRNLIRELQAAQGDRQTDIPREKSVQQGRK
jgi:methyl-accepting chemotaxis protein